MNPSQRESPRQRSLHLYIEEAQEIAYTSGFDLIDQGRYYSICSINGYIYYPMKPYLDYGKGKMIPVADLPKLAKRAYDMAYCPFFVMEP